MEGFDKLATYDFQEKHLFSAIHRNKKRIMPFDILTVSAATPALP
jgi:hypothetical protein